MAVDAVRGRSSVYSLSASDDVGETVPAEVHRAHHLMQLEAHGEEDVLDEEAKGDVPESPASDLEVACTVIGYMTASILIVFFNRYLYTQLFPAPITATWTQQVLGSSWLAGMSLFHVGCPKLCPCFVTHPINIVKTIPLTIAFCGMSSLGNLCLANVQVATYQVARCLTLPFTILFSFLLFRTRQSVCVLLSAATVVLGFVVCLLDVEAMSSFSAAAGGVSSVFQASYFILIKSTLALLGNNENIILFCNAFLASFFLIPVIWVGNEWHHFIWLFSQNPFSIPLIWSGLCFSSFLAFVLTWFSYNTVKITSPVTFNVVGIAKATLQTVLGVLTGDTLSIASAAGVVLRTVGSAWYSALKHHEKDMAAKVAEAQRCKDVEPGDTDALQPRKKVAV